MTLIEDDNALEYNLFNLYSNINNTQLIKKSLKTITEMYPDIWRDYYYFFNKYCYVYKNYFKTCYKMSFYLTAVGVWGW